MLSYEKGTIHHMSEVVTGQSRNGNQWANMTLVLSVPISSSSFKYLALKVSTDMVDDVLQFHVGDKVEVGYSVAAREWEGKWYSNVDLVNIKADVEQFAQAAPVQAAPQSVRQMQQRTAQGYAPQGVMAQRQGRPAPAPMQYGQGELDPSQYDDLPFDNNANPVGR